MAQHQTDVCIVGAGPAGLSLALLLLRSGAEVVVIERNPSLDRPYRGEIVQPGALRLLDDLGVLGPARERGGFQLERFQLIEQDRVLMDIDYRQLEEPFNYLLSIPQRHVLEALLTECRRHQGFVHLDRSKVSELLVEDGRVAGARAGDGQTVHARCVVGADGRYSKVRRLAGIGYDRFDVFTHDVLWFKLPRRPDTTPAVRVYRAGGNPVLMYDSFPGAVQLGWTLPHKTFTSIAARGVDHVREEIAAAVPPYADEVREGIRSLRDVSLLDVFSGCAQRWVQDGLMLIGDSAHTHSPMGAQGINLAIQDAVLSHPVLVEALRSGDASRERLASFEVTRRPDIAQVFKLQRMQSRAILSQGRIAAHVRPRVARLLARTPLYRQVTHRIAYGARPVRVRGELFVGPSGRT